MAWFCKPGRVARLSRSYDMGCLAATARACAVAGNLLKLTRLQRVQRGAWRVASGRDN